MKHAVYGIVQDQSTAERVVDGLRSAGFTGNDVLICSPIKAAPRILRTKKARRRPKAQRPVE